MLIHTVFDIAAAACALAMTFLVYRWRLQAAAERIESLGLGYALALIGGAVGGGYLFGTLNIWLSGEAGIGRSILGALAGAIAAIETYKRLKGVKGSTGIIFVPAFATSVMVGRLGCYFSGIDDYTHGIPATVPWAQDFGDGILRHPVQLYESGAMALFLIATLIALKARSRFFMANGFYLLAIWYGAQRFLWEFLKPYAPIFGPFNIFHALCAGLIIYGIVMIAKERR
jgi:prolipoprotein diacylglyceryltransferase